MKKQMLMIAILFITCFGYSANAQVRVNFNVGVQPLWGPVGYDYVRYYYIPDIDAYYDVANQQYIYFDDGRWVTMASLPPRYGNFDLYRAHKVVINDDHPWYNHDRYRNQYYSYRGRHDQQVIRDSRDSRYWANPEHPYHNQWHGNGNGYGHEEHRDWGGNRGHGDWHERGGEGHDHDRGEGHDRH